MHMLNPPFVMQAMDRTFKIFEQQPERNFCLSLIIGVDALEAIHVTRVGRITRSGLLPLETQQSDGARMLLRMLYSPSDYYGYKLPPLPGSFTPANTTEVLDSFVRLKPLSSPWSTGVYSATLGQEAVVVKYDRDGGREVGDERVLIC